jgi:ATP-binding cassette, subfamily F, member 3
VKSYPGSFEKYLKLKAEEEARQAEVAKRQEQEIAKLDEYVRRFMNSQRTAQARGRLKQMEKLIASKVDAPKQDRNMKAAFQGGKRSGDIVLDLQGLTMGFGDQLLFKDVDWTVQAGERWGVIGENGAGKSTLIKCALGVLDQLGGTARLGSNVVAGYFAQDNVSLDPAQSPIDYLVYEFDLLPADARNLLGRFLFSGDDVFRPIRTLSGGEKNKLVLASLTTLQPNLLVLDEPTNHLDMASREALADVLREFTGTLILISHDRWLLERVTDHTLDLRRDGVRLFPGNYAEYRARQAKPAQKSAPVNLSPQAGTSLSPRELSKEIQRLTKLVAELEEQIHRDEEELKGVEATLANLPGNADVLTLTKRHGEVEQSIAVGMADWEAQSARLEQLRSSQGQ